MGKNTLGDLNNYLFNQLDKLSDKNLKGDNLKEEIDRAKTVAQIATQIIDNGNLALNAKKWFDDRWDADDELPEMLEGD